MCSHFLNRCTFVLFTFNAECECLGRLKIEMILISDFFFFEHYQTYTKLKQDTAENGVGEKVL